MPAHIKCSIKCVSKQFPGHNEVPLSSERRGPVRSSGWLPPVRQWEQELGKKHLPGLLPTETLWSQDGERGAERKQARGVMDSNLAGGEPGAQPEGTCFHQDTEGVMTASRFSPFQFPKLFYIQGYICYQYLRFTCV